MVSAQLACGAAVILAVASALLGWCRPKARRAKQRPPTPPPSSGVADIAAGMAAAQAERELAAIDEALGSDTPAADLAELGRVAKKLRP